MVLNAKIIANATCDGKPLHSLAQKVPKTLVGAKTAKNGKQGSVNYDELNRSQLVAIIDKLMKRQHFITPMYSILFSESYPMGDDDDDDLMADVAWPSSGCRMLRRIPKGWVAQWLLQHFTSVGLTKDHLASLEKDDPSNLMFLLGVVLQVPLTTGLPAAIHEDGAMASKLLYARAESVGMLLRHLIPSGFITDSGFNFSKGAAYTITFGEDGRASHVKHVATKTVVQVPPHVCVTQEFSVQDGWSDAGARVELQPSAFTLWHLFPQDAAFVRLIATEKNAKRLLEGLVTRAASIDNGASVAPSDVQKAAVAGAAVVAETKKLRAKTRTAAAREAVSQKQAARATKRVIKLGST